MSYIERLLERLDEIVGNPQVPEGEVREQLHRFVSGEIRKSYFNGLRAKRQEGRSGERSSSQTPEASK